MSAFAYITNMVFTLSTAKSLRSNINKLTDSNNAYGNYVDLDGSLALFVTNQAGPMIGVSIYKDIVKYETALVVIIRESTCYLLFMANKTIFCEMEIDTDKVQQGDITKLMLMINKLSNLNTVLSNVAPDHHQKGISFGNSISLPYSQDIVKVVPALDKAFTANNLIQAIELKRISFHGETMAKKRYLGIAAALSAFLIIGTDQFLIEKDEPTIREVVREITQIETIKAKLTSSNNADFSELKKFYTVDSVRPYPLFVDAFKAFKLTEQVYGWKASVLEIKKSEDNQWLMIVRLLSRDGNLRDITSFASNNSWSFSFDDGEAILFRYLTPAPLFDNWARFQIGTYEKFISDAVNDWWDDSDISITAYSPSAVDKVGSDNKEAETDDVDLKLPFQVKNIALKIPNFSIYDLASIGSMLDGMPYSLGSMRFYSELEDAANTTSRSSVSTPNETSSGSQPILFSKYHYYNVDINLQFAGVLSK
jgi:hypothetical protein